MDIPDEVPPCKEMKSGVKGRNFKFTIQTPSGHSEGVVNKSGVPKGGICLTNCFAYAAPLTNVLAQDSGIH